MANLRDCLGAAVATGKITEDEAELVHLTADFEANRIAGNGRMSYEEAYEIASKKAIDDFFEGKEIAKRQKVLQIKKVEQALSKAKSHPDGMYTGVMSLLVNDITGKANYSNVDKLTEVIRGMAHSRMAEMLEAYRPKNAGFSSNTQGARDVILEVFGLNTDNADAKFYADAWKQVSEEMRQRFNMAGGAIRKRKDWGMPQSHDPSKLSEAGFKQWYEDISEMLDWEAMRAQYMKNIEADVLGAASVKQAAREQKAKLMDEYQELGAREVELKSLYKNIDQIAASSPDIAKQTAQELRDIRARRKQLRQQIDEIKVTKTEKLEDLPKNAQERLRDELESIRLRYDENTEAILRGDLQPELEKTYEAIVTDGISELDPSGMQKQSGKLANRHSAARELLFKNGEAFLKYHDMYGKGDVYGNMLGHLDTMAGEIALLETLGPNPEFTFNYLRDMVKIELTNKKLVSKGALKGMTGNTKLHFLESVFKVVNGDVNRAVSSTLADLMGGIRANLVAAQLGSATLSATTDLAFLTQTARFNGIPAIKTLKRHLKGLNPKNAQDKRAAVRAGLIADMWIDKTRTSNRFEQVERATGSGAGVVKRMIGGYADAMAKVSDITMRASLLAPWSEAGRHAFGLEFMGMMADNASTTYKGLSKEFRRTLDRYGVTEKDWDTLRKATPVQVEGGASFLRPDDLADAKALGITTQDRNELVAKFMRMIITEAEYAIPSPDARVRAITTMGLERGTIAGEAFRSMAMYKSFPITLIAQQYYRIASIQGLMDKGGYITSYMLGMWVMGAAAYQLKEVAKGREPLDMTTPEFLTAAFAQGGGLGIFGDFIFTDQNRYGNSLAETLTGPAPQFAGDILKLTLGNVQQFAVGTYKDGFAGGFDEMDFGKDVVNFGQKYTPGGSLWYTRAAMDRMMWEQLEMAADPEAKRKFIRLMNQRKKEYNQEYWWEPAVK